MGRIITLRPMARDGIPAPVPGLRSDSDHDRWAAEGETCPYLSRSVPEAPGTMSGLWATCQPMVVSHSEVVASTTDPVRVALSHNQDGIPMSESVMTIPKLT